MGGSAILFFSREGKNHFPAFAIFDWKPEITYSYKVWPINIYVGPIGQIWLSEGGTMRSDKHPIFNDNYYFFFQK